jgi:hypothetical protein
MMRDWGAGTAAEAEVVIAIAAGARSAKTMLRIGRSFPLNALPFLGQVSLSAETGKYKLRSTIRFTATYSGDGLYRFPRSVRNT